MQWPARAEYGAWTADVIDANTLAQPSRGIRRLLLDGDAQTDGEDQQVAAIEPVGL